MKDRFDFFYEYYAHFEILTIFFFYVYMYNYRCKLNLDLLKK